MDQVVVSHKERGERRRRAALWAAEHGEISAAHQFDMSIHYVKKALHEHGLTAPGQRSHRYVSFRVLKMLMDGLTTIDIQKEMKVEAGYVEGCRLWARKAGFEV